MKTGRIVYSCPFVPAEWIAAHGFVASRIAPDSSACATEGPSWLPVYGVCPYALAFAGAARREDADAVVVTTLCDQMRRTSEFIGKQGEPPVFLMNVPKTWQTPAVCGLYADEVRRLGRFLQRLGGQAPSDARLAEVMLEFDGVRAAIRGRREHSSAREYSQTLADFARTGEDVSPRSDVACGLARESADGSGGANLALVGGPMASQDFWVFDFIESSGGRVVLDATESGELGMPPPFDRRRIREDPFGELVSAYFGGVQHPARRPNSGFYLWLRERLRATRARGIILHRYVWCDIWHAEVHRLKEWAGIPLVEIDAAGEGQAQVRTRSRIQALLETLR